MRMIIATSLFHALKEFLADRSFCIKDVEPCSGTRSVMIETDINSPQDLVNLGIWLSEYNINDYKILNTGMKQTPNKAKYFYLPRFNHFNIYQRDENGDGTKIDEAATKEEASRKVYELNGWKLKTNNDTTK